jgi:hypothetical protein
LKTGSYEKVSDDERKRAFIEYAKEATELGVKFSRIKTMAMQVARGFTGARDLRMLIGVMKNIDELEAIFS